MPSCTPDKAPVVSVLLPAYNGAAYLRDSIDSILSQSFWDFELIAIDDGSRDETFSILSAYSDPRMRLYRQDNKGLAKTLNRAIAVSRGLYLARQDQDDLSLHDRILRQVNYLSNHHQCGMVGTWAEIFTSSECGKRFHKHPTDDATIRYHLSFDNPFVHSSVMIRKAVLDDVGSYSTDTDRQPPEDYELWSRIGRKYGLANIPEVLLRYREVETSMSRHGTRPFAKNVVKISSENILLALGTNINHTEASDFAAMMHGNPTNLKISTGFMRLLSILSQLASVSGPSGLSDTIKSYKRHRYRLVRNLLRYYIQRVILSPNDASAKSSP